MGIPYSGNDIEGINHSEISGLRVENRGDFDWDLLGFIVFIKRAFLPLLTTSSTGSAAVDSGQA
jgi:hypothetical protein